MSTPLSALGEVPDTSFAPHPLQAARIAEGVLRPPPSALLSIVVEAARGIGCVAAVAAFVTAATVWVSVVFGR